MKKLKLNLLKTILLSLVIILIPFGFASANILFYEDFEDALDFDSPRDWMKEGKHGSQDLTTEQVRAGSSAYKFSLTRYDSGDYREQITLHNGFNNGSLYFTIGGEYWVGFSLFLADGYHSPTIPNGWVLFEEFHSVPDKPPTCDPAEGIRNAIFHLRTKDANWTSWLQWTSMQCNPLPKVGVEGVYSHYDPFVTGQWVDFVINVKWDYNDDGDGVFKLWKNGVLIINRNGPNCFNDDKGPYLMLGIYGKLDQDQTMTIYCDEFRIGDSSSSYSEVAPGGTIPPPTCQSQGHQCCDSCESGPHLEFDADCPGQVCCEVCTSVPTPTYTILKTNSPPIIDGNINEFNNANSITITNSVGNSATYKMLWDNTALYIAAQGSDDQLGAVNSARDSSLWNDDSIELFFDTLNNGGSTLNSDDYKYLVNLLNTQHDYYNAGGGTSWNTAFASDVTTTGTLNSAGDTDTGYTIEIAIPWVDWVAPSDNDVWGFDVNMNDQRDDGTRVWEAWSQETGLNKPDEFGEIVFSPTVSCVENWTCSTWSAWSECIGNQQSRTRTCTDSNNCGTENDKPLETETQACESSTTYGISNFINLVTDWLKSETGLTSDVNNDGVVNTRDLGIMMSNWQ